MPRYIIKLSHEEKDYYLEWSTVVDAPVSYGMSLSDFKEYYQKEYGRSSMDELEVRLERVEEKGTSCIMDDSVDETIAYNVAGEDGSCLSKEDIIKKYCLTQE